MFGLRKIFSGFHSRRLFSVFTDSIEAKLTKAFRPLFVKVQSSDKVGEEQLQPEEYLNIKVVSEKFEGTELLQRHQMVHKVLADEIAKVHALNLSLLTPEQWKDEPDK